MEQGPPMVGLPPSSCTLRQWSLASPAGPGFFLDSLLASWGALAPSDCLQAANPSPLPVVWPPNPELLLPDPACPGGWAEKHLRLVSAVWHQSSVWESLCFPSALLLLPSPLRLWSSPQSLPVRGFLVCGNISSFTAPSLRCRSHPYSFVSVFSFFFCPTQVCGEFRAFWEVWGLLQAFSRCSVGVVPHVDVFLIYLWGGRWSPSLTPLLSWRSPHPMLNTDLPCQTWIYIMSILYSIERNFQSFVNTYSMYYYSL